MPVYNDPNILNKASYVGLREWSYILRDSTLTSPDYFGIVEFPQKFTAGKNLIKLRAHPQNLVPNSDIHIEILDMNGDPVYYEPLKYIQKDYARVIAIWIYADTVPGPCKVYISGRALRNPETGLILPYSRNVDNNEYLNIPNVLWTRSIPISPYDKNSTEIIHLGTPRVHIKEIVQTYMKPINMEDIVQYKSGSSAQTQTVLLRPITIGGRAGTNNIIPSSTVSPTFSSPAATSPARSPISVSVQPALPGAAAVRSKFERSPSNPPGRPSRPQGTSTGPGPVTNIPNRIPRSPFGRPIGTYIQGANARASVPPGFGGNMLQMPQFRSGPALSAPAGGGLASVEFLGYTSFTGLSELVFDGFPLSESMEGGTITIVNPNIDTDNLPNLVSHKDPSFIVPHSQHVLTGSISILDPANAYILSGIHQLSGSYEFKIVDVLTTTTCHVQYMSGLINDDDYIGNGDFQLLVTHKKPSKNYTGLSFNHAITEDTIEPTSLDKIALSSNFTSSHIEPYVLGFTEASQSFAEIIVSNMEPATGDVYKMKTQYKPGGQFGEYLDLGDTIVEHTHMLVDFKTMESSLSTGVDYNKIGHFSSLEDFDNYWTTTDFPIADENIATATFEPHLLMSGIKLTPAYVNFSSSSRRFSGMHLKPGYRISASADTRYVLNLKGYVEDSFMGSADTKFPYSRVDIYISGSRIEPEQGLNTYKLQNTYLKDLDVDEDDFDYVNGKFGTKVCSIEVDGSGSIDPSTQAVFKTLDDAVVDVYFVIRRGSWSFARINLFTHTDTGWSPNYTRQNVRIPTAFLKTPLAFKFSFYDYTGTVAEAQPIAYPITFTGENTYLDGTDNLLTGSLFIGNAIGNGIELAGVNSAFIRSIGYQGYGDILNSVGQGGFMAYSGSVLPDKTNFEGGGYHGVGLELVADDDSSHLIFGTSPSIFDVKTDKFFLGSTNQFISGALGNIEISSSNFHLDTDGSVVMQGTITATAGGSIGGFVLSSDALTATNFILNTTDSRLTLGSGTDIFIADADEGIWSGAATLGAAPFSVTKAGVLKAELGTIAGWSIGADQLTGGNMEIFKSGEIKSSQFASGVEGSGFQLTANHGGFLEVQNARIRGTLSTTVFEKEAVNAVGGQLYIANSSVLTGSGQLGTDIATPGTHRATDTTMSLENVSGFSEGEILTAKKVHGTGFATEYIRVQSSSRFDQTSDTNFAGFIYVIRGYSGSVAAGTDSGSLGDLASSAQSYSGSQVIVSTGKEGTGYIRLNANPNDPYTPYIDIVERTGSAIYDVDLKVRLGDLSGITDHSFSDGVSGYGIYTGNGYFKGKIEVASLPAAPSSDGLIGYYPLQGSSIDVSGSKITLDLSGNQYHTSGSLALIDPENFTSGPGAGPTGGALNFDGNSTVVHVTHMSQSFTANMDISIAWWQKQTGQADQYAAFHFAKSTYNNEFALFADDANIDGQYRLWAPGEAGIINIDSGSLPIKDTWRHFCVTAPDNGSGSLYIDGVHKGYFTSSLVNWDAENVEQILIGADADAGPAINDYFEGQMSEFRFYNKTLTDQEVQSLFLSPSAVGGRTIIEGNRVTSGQLRSNNWGPSAGSEFNLNAGTIQLGGSTNPGFDVTSAGIVTATNFTRKTITVNSGNLAAYTAAVTGGVNLLFDGSGTGGEICMHLILEVDPGLIKGFVVPQSAAGKDSTVTVDVGVDGVEFDDATVSGGMQAWATLKGY